MATRSIHQTVRHDIDTPKAEENMDEKEDEKNSEEDYEYRKSGDYEKATERGGRNEEDEM